VLIKCQTCCIETIADVAKSTRSFHSKCSKNPNSLKTIINLQKSDHEHIPPGCNGKRPLSMICYLFISRSIQKQHALLISVLDFRANKNELNHIMCCKTRIEKLNKKCNCNGNQRSEAAILSSASHVQHSLCYSFEGKGMQLNSNVLLKDTWTYLPSFFQQFYKKNILHEHSPGRL